MGFGRDVCIVGIGTAGCKIASQLSKECKMLEHFVYISCDEHDLAPILKGTKLLIGPTITEKSSPYFVRGTASPSDTARIRQLLGDSKVLIIISGLGGAVGTAFAPLVAREAALLSSQCTIAAVLIMPQSNERTKHFFAGCALKQISKLASGIVLVDNDELLLRSKSQSISLIDSYAIINQQIAMAINTLVLSSTVGQGTPEKGEIELLSLREERISHGLSNIKNFFEQNPCTVVEPSESRNQLLGQNTAGYNAVEEIACEIGPSTTSVIISQSNDRDRNGREEGSESGGDLHQFTSFPKQLKHLESLADTKFESYEPIEKALGSINGRNLEELSYDSVSDLGGRPIVQLDTYLRIDIGLSNLEA